MVCFLYRNNCRITGFTFKIISKASLFTLFYIFSQSKSKTYLGNEELGVHHQVQYAQLLFNTTSSQTTVPKSSIAQATSSQEQPLPEEQPGPSREIHRRRQTRSTFGEVFEAHSERRTAALESLVRPDLERQRRLKERRRRVFEKNQ